jgi:hypothetical protein
LFNIINFISYINHFSTGIFNYRNGGDEFKYLFNLIIKRAKESKNIALKLYLLSCVEKEYLENFKDEIKNNYLSNNSIEDKINTYHEMINSLTEIIVRLRFDVTICFKKIIYKIFNYQ